MPTEVDSMRPRLGATVSGTLSSSAAASRGGAQTISARAYTDVRRPTTSQPCRWGSTPTTASSVRSRTSGMAATSPSTSRDMPPRRVRKRGGGPAVLVARAPRTSPRPVASAASSWGAHMRALIASMSAQWMPPRRGCTMRSAVASPRRRRTSEPTLTSRSGACDGATARRHQVGVEPELLTQGGDRVAPDHEAVGPGVDALARKVDGAELAPHRRGSLEHGNAQGGVAGAQGVGGAQPGDASPHDGDVDARGRVAGLDRPAEKVVTYEKVLVNH